ncbi:LCP family protein [Actinomyces sp. B33]|uniref:LCP family protein n=1 Tax=Actinomyces sp. B33 TaxID=2942131 RepID=UPI00234018CE|nr:LCP family protein [Actinomyces sp. B33]MDC4232628.1 LCP family protein [Actinomyces sp. B33]
MHGTRGRSRTVQHAATSPYRFGVARSVAAVALSVALFVVSTAGFLYQSFARQVEDSALDISGLGASPQSGPQEPELPADQFQGRPLNILLVGVDSREGENANVGAGDSSDVESLRGDTTMVVHVSADRSRIQVVSIPRDTWTDIPSCTRMDGSVSGSTEGMFNTAFAIGANWGTDIASGIACTKSTVEEMTGLTIDAFGVVDFAGFISMVNALGGVWFNLDEPAYDELARLDLPAGCQLLNGDQALSYARARYDLGDGSDISRIGRQQQLVSAIMRELLAKNYVTDFPALVSFLQASIGSLKISPNLSDINTDAGLLLSLLDIDRAQIQFITMPNAPAPWDKNRVIAVEPMATMVWDSLIADQPLPPSTEYTDGNGQVLVVPDPDLAPSPGEGAESGVQSDPADGSSPAADQQEPSADPAAQSAPAPTQTCPPNR